ncbi:MAG: cytochrome c [Gammaproteobacteria bacterium]|nr:cytochrome c [Gammaproteobacteria bacterium]MDH3858157.1 cytochrome c [Gammaproteobacteria bacterium]
MKRCYTVAVLVLCLGSLQAADIDNGDDLHFSNCTGCHDPSVYTRDNRRVRDLAQLGTQVRFCKDTLELTWFDDEVEDVVGYLNQTYYHF